MLLLLSAADMPTTPAPQDHKIRHLDVRLLLIDTTTEQYIVFIVSTLRYTLL